MKAEKIAKEIIKWESENGESFNDYFTHDTVQDKDWLIFLISKGFQDRAQEIKDDTHSPMGCMDQELLYEIYPERNGTEDYNWINYEKNVALMAEFLSGNETYEPKFKDFLLEDE